LNNTFIHQGRIKFIKSDIYNDFHINAVLLNFLFIKEYRKIKYQFPHKYEAVFDTDNNHKCVLIIRSSY